MKTKAYAYISINSGSSDSIEHQKKAIWEYCEKRNITDIEYFDVIRNKSVRDADGYKTMLEKMKEDKEGDRIFVASELSKVTRSLEEWIKIEEDMKKSGIECHMASTGPISLMSDELYMLRCNS